MKFKPNPRLRGGTRQPAPTQRRALRQSKAKEFTKYDIEAQPTDYAGVKFRSQLEACWASFFDLNEIEWEYEPIRLPGWIPDFRLFGKFLCEVKPIPMTGFAVASTEYQWIRKTLGNGQVLIFGDGPSECLACMVHSDGMSISGRTVFFDRYAPFKMVSVGDDGGSHPLRNSTGSKWGEAYRNLTVRPRVTPGLYRRKSEASA